VREVISSGDNGLLVPFFAVDELAGRVIEALQKPERFNAIRAAARRFVIEHYDAKQICVPLMRQLLDLKASSTSARRNVWAGRPASEWSKATRRSLQNAFAPIDMEMSDEGEFGQS
jgi:hypothetical protein